ncbi:MBL fold metallo-hydrolase [Clostridium sp. LBM24168]
MEISFLGGAHEVGGSCILLNICNKNILLDCGIRQSSSKDPIPDFKIIQENGGIDAIVISHAHMDHIGCLPIISKEYPMARIYTNVMTKYLMKVLLYDSLKIMNNREIEIPLYAEKDVKSMLSRVFPVNYMVEFSIFQDMKLCFYAAGHIAGASCIYIKSPEGTVFYSGDFSIFSQRTVDGLKLPKLRPDVGIFETTYGDRLHSNREVEEERLIKVVNECALNGGKMLIPAFALGRAQEIILMIKRAINNGKIKGIKVYVDGMIRDINKIYKLGPLYLKNSLGKKILRGMEPFYDDNIIPVKNKENREKIVEDGESCIIISSSGMLTGGFSQYYAEKLAPVESSYIIITGYQDEESPGRKLLNLLEKKDRKLELNGKLIPVRCRVEKVGLSAHSDKGEIKSLIKILSPRNIFMVHGDGKIIENFSKEISCEIRSRVYSPKCGENYCVNINNPRKQISRQIKRIMKEDIPLNKIDMKKLWKFVLDNYGQKFFTVEELAFIWTGCRNLNGNLEAISNFQQNLISSIYFENDMRRLFMFRPKLDYEVAELLKPRELKPNELNDLVNEYFGDFKFKKASFIYGQKNIILNFDFPSIVKRQIYDVMDKFKKDTEWNVEISNSVNINEASSIINKILYGADIKKISYKLDENKVEVNLNSNFYVDKNILEKFTKCTGLKLIFKLPVKVMDKEVTLENNKSGTAMEQNKALNLIDSVFKDKEFKPYRKSIKSNKGEKYIELGFITPMIGKKYENDITELGNITGWSMKISSSVNQNQIINGIKLLCSIQNVRLKKNPSFNIVDLTVTLKLKNSEPEEKVQLIKEKIEHDTGCTVIFSL